MTSVNISLDTLCPDKFADITRRDKKGACQIEIAWKYCLNWLWQHRCEMKNALFCSYCVVFELMWSYRQEIFFIKDLIEMSDEYLSKASPSVSIKQVTCSLFSFCEVVITWIDAHISVFSNVETDLNVLQYFDLNLYFYFFPYLAPRVFESFVVYLCCCQHTRVIRQDQLCADERDEWWRDRWLARQKDFTTLHFTSFWLLCSIWCSTITVRRYDTTQSNAMWHHARITV